MQVGKSGKIEFQQEKEVRKKAIEGKNNKVHYIHI